MDSKVTRLFSGVALILILAVPMTVAAQDRYPAPGALTGGHPFGAPEGGPIDCNNPDNPVVNCGFEAGLASWTAADLTMPFLPLQAVGAGYTVGYGFFATAPTEGTMVALTGFDGNGPGTIELGQDVTIPAGGAGTLTFDYRGAWDLATFGATLDRTFGVDIEPAGGGAPLQSNLVLTATSGTNVTDSGALSGTVDVSAFTGQTVRVNFVWTVPETLSGPGQFQLDNVNVAVQAGGLPIPTLGQYGLAGLTLLLLLFGLRFIGRNAG